MIAAETPDTDGNLSFSFELVYISDIDPAPLLDSPSPDDAVLAILCRNGNTRQNIRRILARHRGTRPRRPERRDGTSGNSRSIAPGRSGGRGRGDSNG